METRTPGGSTHGLRRALGVQDLVLFNIAAILGLRWLSTSAQTGPSSDILRVRGGSVAVWTVTALGFTATMLSIVLAMTPPEGTEAPGIFAAKTIGGTFLFLVAGLGFYIRGRRKV